MKPYKIDIAVLLIFWARPEQFGKVFEQVKKARPSKLYLYQDGPRKNWPDDIENIEKCREIAEDIDWECTVNRFCQENNVGCDPSGFIAQKWMFGKEEFGIVLEDDVVPSQSFFPFCKELLEKYKDDERIHMICGMNNTGISEHVPYSYFFSTKGSIWGWASWKRVIDTWDENYSFLQDSFTLRQLEEILREKGRKLKHFLKVFVQHKQSGKAHHESINASSMYLNNQLNIVPKYNMISNIGISDNATHAASDVRVMPRGIRAVFNMIRYEMDFPLKHPKYVIEDILFKKQLNRIMGFGHPYLRRFRKLESIVLQIRYNGLKKVVNKAKVKILG